MTESESVEIGGGDLPLPGLLLRPPGAFVLYVLAHGAGAGMRHRFMAAIAAALAEEDVATLRWEFQYMAAGSRRPDRPAVATAAVARAVAAGAELCDDLPVIAGGKSFGGRMTSQAAAAGLVPAARGLAFLGFPLHPAGRAGTERAAHLADVDIPMLFVQGTRDALADLALLEPAIDGLGPGAMLHREDGADHGFHVPKRSGRNDDQVLASIAAAVSAWAGRTVGHPRPRTV